MGRLWLWLTATESGALTLNATSAALFAVQGIFVTRASRTAADAGGVGVVEVPGTQLVVLRASLQLLTVLLWRCCAKSFPLLGPKKIRHLVMARGFFGSFGFTVYYHAIATLPLGDAITLLSLYPISTMVLASVFLGEEMQAVAVAAALFSAAGSVLIARPTFLFDADAAAAAAPLLSNATAAAAGCHGLMCATAEEEEGDADVPWLQTQASGYVAAGMGALLAGVVFTLIRKCKDAHALSLIFAFTMCAIVNDGLLGACCYLGFVVPVRHLLTCPCTILGLFFEVEVWPSREAIFADEATMTACVGVMITGTAAHFLMNYSMRNAPAGISSIVRSSDILWCACFCAAFDAALLARWR